jgi:hypothetical protein
MLQIFEEKKRSLTFNAKVIGWESRRPLWLTSEDIPAPNKRHHIVLVTGQEFIRHLKKYPKPMLAHRLRAALSPTVHRSRVLRIATAL